MPRPVPPRRRLASCSLALTAAALFASPADAQDPASPTLDAHRRGWAALDRAAGALGGWERLAELEGLTVWMRGSEVNRFQSPSAEPPYDTLPIAITLVVDIAGERLGTDVAVTWPDFTQHVRRVAGPAYGVIAFGVEGEGRMDSTLVTADLEPVARRLPHYLLLTARSRPAAVRHLGTAKLEDRSHDLIHVSGSDGEPLTLWIDHGTGRITAHERLADDWRSGDAAYRMRYRDWTTDGPVPHPRRIDVTQAGRALARATADSVRARVAALETLFARHDAAAESPAPDGAESLPTVRTLADGVHLVERLEGRNYNVLFIELGDGLVAVDAPLGEAACRRALAVVREVTGPMPLRWVVPTHHHSDHAAGVRAFVVEGATLLTTRGNVGLFTDVVGASRSLDGGPARRGPPPALAIETLEEGHRVLEAGNRAIHVHDVGPNPHADEHLIVHVPWAELVFQGDLVRFPEEGIEAARPQARALMRWIEREGLEQVTIAGTYGRPGSVGELRAALKAAERR